jgi:hypothetical protein
MLACCKGFIFSGVNRKNFTFILQSVVVSRESESTL